MKNNDCLLLILITVRTRITNDIHLCVANLYKSLQIEDLHHLYHLHQTCTVLHTSYPFYPVRVTGFRITAKLKDTG